MPPSSPLISIIIPTHNRPGMLDEAIASVRAQTFTDYEIIVVSNGERDPETSRRIAMRHGCNFLTIKKGNRSLARNIAINHAQGDWIALLDDDDLWCSRHKLLLQLAFAANTGADCIFTDFILRGPNGIERHSCKMGTPKQMTAAEAFMLKNYGSGGCSCVLVKRQSLAALGGFDTKMALTEDWDMWRRVSEKYRVAFLNEALTICRTHGENGENMLFLHPWRCIYWDVYHQMKAIRYAPAELRHMTLRIVRAMAWRTFYLGPHLYFAESPPDHWSRRLPRVAPSFERLRKQLRARMSEFFGRLRRWLRPRSRINALFGREIFKKSGPPGGTN